MSNPETPKSWWPYGLTAYFVFFLTSVGLFISFALRQDTHLVRADYYRAEVEHQQEIDRQSRAALLGHDAVIEYSARHGKVGVKIPSSHAAAKAAGSVRFYRPNDPALDHSVPLEAGEDGKQFIDVRDVPTGSWRVRLEWRLGEVDYAKTAKIAIVRSPS